MLFDIDGSIPVIIQNTTFYRHNQYNHRCELLCISCPSQLLSTIIIE